jgi:hypothetical protein
MRSSDAAAANLRTAHQISPGDAFSSAWLAYVEIARGNRVEGTRLLERTEQLIGKSRSMIFLAELALGYARVGREADARRLNDEIHAIGARRPKEGAPTRWPPRPSATTTRCCVGSRSPTAKVRNHEVDEGFIALNNLRMNVTADPALEQPRVRAALDRIRGD